MERDEAMPIVSEETEMVREEADGLSERVGDGLPPAEGLREIAEAERELKGPTSLCPFWVEADSEMAWREAASRTVNLGEEEGPLAPPLKRPPRGGGRGTPTFDGPAFAISPIGRFKDPGESDRPTRVIIESGKA